MVQYIFLVGEWTISTNMISVIKFRVSMDTADCTISIREKNEMIRGAVTNHLLSDLLTWGAERMKTPKCGCICRYF